MGGASESNGRRKSRTERRKIEEERKSSSQTRLREWSTMRPSSSTASSIDQEAFCDTKVLYIVSSSPKTSRKRLRMSDDRKSRSSSFLKDCITLSASKVPNRERDKEEEDEDEEEEDEEDEEDEDDEEG